MTKKMFSLMQIILIIVFACYSVEYKTVLRDVADSTTLEMFPNIENRQLFFPMNDNAMVLRYKDTVFTWPMGGTDTSYAQRNRIERNDAFVECNIDSTITISPSGTLKKINVADDAIISPLTADGTKDMYLTTGTDPGNGSALWLTSAGAQLRKNLNGRDRLGIYDDNTELSVGGNIRLDVDVSRSQLYSPDRSSSLYIGNTISQMIASESNIQIDSSGPVRLMPKSGEKIIVSDDVIISPVTADGTKRLTITNDVDGSMPNGGGSFDISSSFISMYKGGVNKHGIGTTDNSTTILQNYNPKAAFSAFESYIRAGTAQLRIFNDSVATVTNTIAHYDSSTNNTAIVNKEILENRLLVKRDIVKGWEDEYGVVYSFDDPTRVLTASHPSGFCEFHAGGIRYNIANGDPRLSVTIPDLNQWNYASHDTLGQLISRTSVPLESIRRENLGPIILYNGDLNVSFAGILRNESEGANDKENEASYETKSIVASESVIFDATLLGNVVGHTEGTYYSSRDKRFEFNAVAGGSKTWVKYYQDGIDDAGCNYVKASASSDGIPYITDVDLGTGATGRLVYNNWNPALNGGLGAFEVLTGATNDYVAVHYIVGDGITRNVLATIGQATYNSLADARSGLKGERDGLVFETTVFRDVGIVASCIFKTNGQLQYVDTDLLTLFDYPAGGVTALSGVGTATTLQTAYNNSVQPQITVDGTRGAFQVKDGEGGGAPIFEVLDSSGAFVWSVSDTGIDAGGQGVVNVSDLEVAGASAAAGNIQICIENTTSDGYSVLELAAGGGPQWQVSSSGPTASTNAKGFNIFGTQAGLAATIDSFGVQKLLQATTSEISIGGSKAVVTKEWVNATAPTTTTSTGVAGTFSYDGTYFYVCTATNTWGRVALDFGF